jgi:class 3 adenylate cyclase
VNVAARLASAAAPGDILVTTALVEAARAGGVTLPDLHAIAPLELKGIADPVAAYRIRR